MLRKIIEAQKEELRNFNKNYLLRTKFEMAKKSLNLDLIKVIIGPRRAGKSILAHLMLQDTNYAYVNFDDDNLLDIEDTDELIKILFEIYEKPQYLFFDEIQNLNNWELFINKLHRRGLNLILTGSNANLLSRELASSLTGRHYTIEILPFSYKEVEQHCSLMTYIKQGGFPEVVLKGYEPRYYLSTLVDSVLLKDIVKRYRIRYPQKLLDLFTYLVSNFASQVSFNKLKNILKFNSVHTTENYLSYLEQAYLIFTLQRYSHKLKEQINAPKKVYISDNGFIEAKAISHSKNLGKLIENLVFIELINRGFRVNLDLFYYQTNNGHEIDFLLREGHSIQELIQVSYDISNPETYQREVRALLKAAQELHVKRLILINMDIDKDEVFDENQIIHFISLKNWLLLNSYQMPDRDL